MLAACKGSRAIFSPMFFCLIGSIPTYAQSAAFFDASRTPSNRLRSGAWLAKCDTTPGNTLGVGRFSSGSEWPADGNDIPGDVNLPRALEGACLEPALSAQPRSQGDNPCRQVTARAPGALVTLPCNEAPDIVPAELSALGKRGAKIARARAEVLEILRSDNACTEWLETKDANPAATFQSLYFLLDEHGSPDILESMESDSLRIFRQPYVAQATQDGGAHTAITINANGAFYRSQGSVEKVSKEEGPYKRDGTRLLMVGSYRGDTLSAQMITLLHEFGHIIDLLPEDMDNLDGKSVRNTSEVLRHCRAEVEVRSQLAGKR